MNTVIVESPFKGDVERNQKYLKACLLDCLGRGEAPYASHLFFTQILDDTIEEERSLGIRAGLAIGERLDRTVVYINLGISSGMMDGIKRANDCNRKVEFRFLEDSEWI